MGGRDWSVAVSIGVGQYPAHGRDAQALLRQAFAQAGGTTPLGRAGFTDVRDGGRAEAANDEVADG